MRTQLVFTFVIASWLAVPAFGAESLNEAYINTGATPIPDPPPSATSTQSAKPASASKKVDDLAKPKKSGWKKLLHHIGQALATGDMDYDYNYPSYDSYTNEPRSPVWSQPDPAGWSPPSPTFVVPSGKGGAYHTMNPDGSIGTVIPMKGGGYAITGQDGSYTSITPNSKGGGYTVFGSGGYANMRPAPGGGYIVTTPEGGYATLQPRAGGGYTLVGADGTMTTILPGPGGTHVFPPK